jgi:hypothetical protein
MSYYKPRRNRYGVKLDAPCQRQDRYALVSHQFIPWDAHPGYSRCFCGLVQGPRGGLYEGAAPWLPSPVEKIEAAPTSLFAPEELPPINYWSRARRREWRRILAEKAQESNGAT